MLRDEVNVGQRHVSLHHVKGRVAEDALEREGVPAVDEVGACECVPQQCGLQRPGSPARRFSRLKTCWTPER